MSRAPTLFRHAVPALRTRARRRLSPRPGRFGTGLALIAAAAGARGALGVLLAVIGFMVVVDALLPMPASGVSEAEDAFRRAVRRRRAAAALRRMRRRAPERLEVIDDATGWAAVAERRPLGVRPIPLDSITGTVEALKARTFDAGLRPAASARDRWRAVWLAQARGAELPPIAVYRVDGRHVLRDGHHRASAARALGRERIEAEVIELRRAVSPAGAPSSSATRRRDALPRRPVAC